MPLVDGYKGGLETLWGKWLRNSAQSKFTEFTDVATSSSTGIITEHMISPYTADSDYSQHTLDSILQLQFNQNVNFKIIYYSTINNTIRQKV